MKPSMTAFEVEHLSPKKRQSFFWKAQLGYALVLIGVLIATFIQFFAVPLIHLAN